jgi:hypothetical protein
MQPCKLPHHRPGYVLGADKVRTRRDAGTVCCIAATVTPTGMLAGLEVRSSSISGLSVANIKSPMRMRMYDSCCRQCTRPWRPF